jgi:hypothetical protein
MPRPSSLIHSVIPLACTLFLDVLRFLGLCLRPSPALAAENLFLRTQLALYQEHHVTPRRVSLWCGCPGGVSGGPRWRLSNPRPSCGGGAKGSDGSGTAHRPLDGPRSQWNCKRSSGRWRMRTSRGDSGASPMSYG